MSNRYQPAYVQRTAGAYPCGLFLLVSTLVCGVVARPEALRAQKLEEQLVRYAPDVIEYLQTRQLRNVGVLKFRVKNGDGAIGDSVGDLNRLMAERLEAALVLANPDDPDQQLGIVRNASATAERIRDASHLSPKGRDILFSETYPLAWGNRRVRPDAFVTGILLVSPDLRDMNVCLLAFGRNDEELIGIVRPFRVEIDGRILPELGESFFLRSVLAGNNDVRTDPVDAARIVRDRVEQEFPLSNAPAVAFRVFYDGDPVALEFADGEARIPEPSEGQKVIFRLERVDTSQTRLAVVVKVNGENTFYRQRLPDLECNKWVLDPDCSPVEIRGFQIDNAEAEKFHVLSREESKKKEMYYGPDVGTISVVVFRERELPPPVDLSEEAEDLAAVQKAWFPEQSSANAAAMKARMRAAAMSVQTRGLITAGETTARKTYKVKFDPDPTPILAATIRYYQP